MAGTQSEVKAAVESYIRSSASDTIRSLGEQGGYAQLPADTVEFLGKPRPYWYRSGSLTAPDASQQLTALLTSTLNANKAALAASFPETAFGDARVTAVVRDTAVDVTVAMPTTVKGYSIAQPYSVSVPSKYGALVRTARELAEAQASQRYLERFLQMAIFTSPYKGPTQTAPTWLYLTRCGQFVSKSSLNVRPEVETLLHQTLSHLFLPGQAPEFRAELAPSASFGDERAIATQSAALSAQPPVISQQTLGRTYLIPLASTPAVNATFHLPDGFSLDSSTFAMSPDPATATALPIAFTPLCASDLVLVTYSARFPAIARLVDRETGATLVFALDAALTDSQPAAFAPLEPSLCASPACAASVLVEGADGAAIPGAEVTFLGCPLGRTDSAGRLSAPAPCGAGPLTASAEGYSAVPARATPETLGDSRVLLLKTLSLRVHAREAFIRNDTLTKQYHLDAIEPLQQATGRVTFHSLTRPGTVVMWDLTSAESTQSLPADLYQISLSLLDSKNQQPLGAGLQRTFINTTVRDLYILFPHPDVFPQAATAADVGRTSEVATILSGFLSKCNVGLVRDTPAQAGCSAAAADI
ncbi:MAG TPA: hypothetical protein VJB16_00235, partial [archaeon]|nr:hypothetical protein [archaeon]